MGRSPVGAGGGHFDEVFVPHYKSYPHSMASRSQPQGGFSASHVSHRSGFVLPPGVRGGEKGSGIQQTLSPSSVLPLLGTQQPWQSSLDGSSMSSVDNYQQSISVGLHLKLSEFQVALRASERAREDGERETNALRLYVGNVETSATGLVSRIQDLEHLLALSSAFQRGQDVDQLRGKVATEMAKEAQKQATAAAQAVAAAREATMELDKVKRESNALTTAQEAEIERLSLEVAECRMLYEQRQLEQQNCNLKDTQKKSQVELVACQKKYEAVMKDFHNLKEEIEERRSQLATMEKEGQCNKLVQALELSTAVGKAAKLKLEELLYEKKEVLLQKERLENQVKEIQSRQDNSDYDRAELRQVRAALGGEKAHLLDDLAQLRRSNQIPKQSSPGSKVQNGEINSPTRSTDVKTISNQPSNNVLNLKPHFGESPIPETSFSSASKAECSYSQEELEEERLSVSSAASPSESGNTGPVAVREKVLEVFWSQSLNDGGSKGVQHAGNSLEQSFRNKQVVDYLSGFENVCKQDEEEVLPKVSQTSESSEIVENSSTETGEMCLAIKDSNLLAAAQREIVKLREINQQLVAACQ